MLLVLLSCSEQAPAPRSTPRTVEDCAVYVGDDAHGICLALVASQGGATACDEAGAWTDLCSQASVGVGETTLEAALTACGDADDCRFEVLDRALAGAPATEGVSACREHAGVFAGDCVRHAVAADRERALGAVVEACGGDTACTLVVLGQRPAGSVGADLDLCARHLPGDDGCFRQAGERWLRGGPDASSAALVAGRAPDSAGAGRLLGTAVACFEVGRCEDLAGATARSSCEDAVTREIPARPAICEAFVGHQRGSVQP